MAGTLIEAYGKIYTGGDVKVRMLNLSPEGIDAVKYGDKQAKENVYTMGSREPMARLHKQVDYEGSITVKAIVLDALEKVAPGGAIHRIKPFELGITYLDEDSAVIKHDNIIFCEFTGQSREVKNDNSELVYELELSIGGIDRNV